MPRSLAPVCRPRSCPTPRADGDLVDAFAAVDGRVSAFILARSFVAAGVAEQRVDAFLAHTACAVAAGERVVAGVAVQQVVSRAAVDGVSVAELPSSIVVAFVAVDRVFASAAEDGVPPRPPPQWGQPPLSRGLLFLY